VSAQTFVTAAVEGDLDEAVLRRILELAGLSLANVYGREGKHKLLQRLAGYNLAARFSPWIVLLDLDEDCPCAPECTRQWLPAPSQYMCFRLAVRAVEAWLLADRERIARRLGVNWRHIPSDPDTLADPKTELVNLARRSTSRPVRDQLVPQPGSGRQVGPLYNSLMIQFVDDQDDGWRPERAAESSDSLNRCIAQLRKISAGL